MCQKNKNKTYVLDKSKFSNLLNDNKNQDVHFEVHDSVKKMQSWNNQNQDPRKIDKRLKKIIELKEMSQSFVNSIDKLEKSKINFKSNKKIEQEIINENKRLEKESEKKFNFFKNLEEKNQWAQEVYNKEFKKEEIIKLIDKK